MPTPTSARKCPRAQQCPRPPLHASAHAHNNAHAHLCTQVPTRTTMPTPTSARKCPSICVIAFFSRLAFQRYCVPPNASGMRLCYLGRGLHIIILAPFPWTGLLSFCALYGGCDPCHDWCHFARLFRWVDLCAAASLNAACAACGRNCRNRLTTTAYLVWLRVRFEGLFHKLQFPSDAVDRGAGCRAKGCHSPRSTCDLRPSSVAYVFSNYALQFCSQDEILGSKAVT
jgi:hypothetical protein